jgi:hypothetical protein
MGVQDVSKGRHEEEEITRRDNLAASSDAGSSTCSSSACLSCSGDHMARLVILAEVRSVEAKAISQRDNNNE